MTSLSPTLIKSMKSPMAEGIERWPFIPRVSGFDPQSWQLGKIHGLRAVRADVGHRDLPMEYYFSRY